MSLAAGGQNVHGALCGRGSGTWDAYRQPDRITVPLKRAGKRGEGKWKPIGWDQLIEELCEGGKLFAWFGCLFWLIVWVIMVITGGIATLLGAIF